MKLIDVRDLAGLGSAKAIRGVGAPVDEPAREGERVSATVAMEGVSLPFDEYVEMVEAMSDDPDGFVPTERSRALLTKYAYGGAKVGYNHGGPSYVSVGAPFLAAASGVQIGLDHAG